MRHITITQHAIQQYCRRYGAVSEPDAAAILHQLLHSLRLRPPKTRYEAWREGTRVVLVINGFALVTGLEG